MIEQRHAVALIMYLQRAHSIIPTTLAESDTMRPLIEVIEKIANGQVRYDEVGGVPNPHKANGHGKDIELDRVQ